MPTPTAAVRPMRIGLLSAWSSRSGGGVFEAVVSLARTLKETGRADPVVFALEDEFTAQDRGRFGDVPVHAFSQYGPRSFGLSPRLFHALCGADLDLVHLHGIWMFPSVAGQAWAANTKKPYVISPHGMLEPWILGRSRAKKALARSVYEDRNITSARRIHALTAQEAIEIKAIYPLANVVELPNGVDLSAADAPHRRKDDHPPFVLYLGRLHPKKNIEALIEAWHSLAGHRPEGIRLKIAGWGEDSYVRTIHAAIEAATSDGTIDFVGPAFGNQKADLLRRAQFVVLPSFSEGLPMVLLEAWAVGTPTLQTAACNMQIGIVAGAAKEIGPSVSEVAIGLSDGLGTTDSDWADMSQAAMDLVRSRFSSAAIGRAWTDLYHDLVFTKPDDRPLGLSAA